MVFPISDPIQPPEEAQLGSISHDETEFFSYTVTHWIETGSYPVHTRPRGRGTRPLHSEESSGTPPRPTAWSLGHIFRCNQKSWNPFPLGKRRRLVSPKIVAALIRRGPEPPHLPPRISCLPGPPPPAHYEPGEWRTRWSSTG